MKDDFYGKRVVIIGLARQGKALAKFASKAGAKVTVSDMMSEEDGRTAARELAEHNIEYVFGHHPLSLLDDADYLAISGGVPADAPIVQEAMKRGVTITNDSLEFRKRVKAPLVGITGSAGKTTTTALTGFMVEKSGTTAWVGGNIGRPLISELENIDEADVVIQELSSFQLEYWTKSPDVAAVLNITPNHLDRHGTMELYTSAKANILKHQNSQQIALLSADDTGAQSLLPEVKGRLREFSRIREVKDGAFIRDGELWLRDTEGEKSVIAVGRIPLRGLHNVSNVLASAALADSVGVSSSVIEEAILQFKSVEHRLEEVAVVGGVRYFNDSIATSPERAIAAIESFEEPLLLLAGGKDKAMVWDSWAQCVLSRVRTLILFGDLAELLLSKIREWSQGVSPDYQTDVVRSDSMEEALLMASRLAKPGDVVLLSPGGTSFDAYKDFAQRGVHFKALVMELAAKL